MISRISDQELVHLPDLCLDVEVNKSYNIFISVDLSQPDNKEGDRVVCVQIFCYGEQ